ncbi:MAG: hypothetical protein Q8O24_08215 [Gallionellaceae bacterium]|nr:hypothetical protein [Gallionellaceae bacterium]
MPIVVSEHEFQQIIDSISQYPEGVGIEELAQKFESSVGRAIKYRLAQNIVVAVGSAQGVSTAQGVGEVYIPISAESEVIKSYVRQQRKLISYQIAFLE